jgi:hypothetical protein
VGARDCWGLACAGGRQRRGVRSAGLLLLQALLLLLLPLRGGAETIQVWFTATLPPKILPSPLPPACLHPLPAACPQTVHIHPSSGLSETMPRWLVYHELGGYLSACLARACSLSCAHAPCTLPAGARAGWVAGLALKLLGPWVASRPACLARPACLPARHTH